MNKKLFLFDLDGTLSDSSEERCQRPFSYALQYLWYRGSGPQRTELFYRPAIAGIFSEILWLQ